MTTTWGGQPAVFPAVEAARGSLALATGSSLLAVGAAGVTELIRQTNAARSQTEALMLLAIVHAEAVGAYTRLGQRSMRGWLRRQFLISRREATRLLDLAAKLKRCEQTTAALGKGIVSVEVATIVATAISNLPAEAGPDDRADAETAMLEQASTLEPEQLVIFGKRLAELLTAAPNVDDPQERKRLLEAEERAERSAYERRSVTLLQLPDGSLRIVGVLPAELGAVVRHMLEHLAKPCKGDAGVTDSRSLGQRLADALVEIVRTTHLVDDTGGTRTEDDDGEGDHGEGDDGEDGADATTDDEVAPTNTGSGNTGGGNTGADAGQSETPVWPDQPTFDDFGCGEDGAGQRGRTEKDPAGGGESGQQHSDTASRADEDRTRHTGASFQPSSGTLADRRDCPDCASNNDQREKRNGKAKQKEKGQAGGKGRSRPGLGGVVPYQVSIHLDYDKLMAELPGAGMLDDGTILPTSALLRILCDSELIPVVLDGKSLPLHLGRRRRRFSPAQHTALAARDRGCSYPGCERLPRECQAHHCRTWTKDKGPTDISNGVLLCLRHHQLVHREGWIARTATNGYPEFIPPHDYDPERRPRQHYRYRGQPAPP